MPFRMNKSGVARYPYVSKTLCKFDHDRPLEKTELVELLKIDAIEFELLLVNTILRPSRSIEYYPGRFLGFFTYWDCVAVKIFEVLQNMEHSDIIFERVDEIVSYIAGAQSRNTLQGENFLMNSNELYCEVLKLIAAGEIDVQFSKFLMAKMELIFEEIEDLTERFTILFAEESRYDFSPFAIEVNEFLEYSHADWEPNAKA